MVDRFDGQLIWIQNEPCYELGNYLGGGASGFVHEAVDLKSNPISRNVAIKELSPVGYKLMAKANMQSCVVARKGTPISSDIREGRDRLTVENVWWLVHPNSKQVIAALEDALCCGRFNELPLPKCIEIWGWNPFGMNDMFDLFTEEDKNSASGCDKIFLSGEEFVVDGFSIPIPRVPPKYLQWLRSRRNIYREISNMSRLGSHPNVIKLYEVLERVQETKSNLFLVLELVTGGELFDRMKNASDEETTRRYFVQLLHGLEYCHGKGVCHRDLKPENLLLSDNTEHAVVKIADFGLSAAFAIARNGNEEQKEVTTPHSGNTQRKPHDIRRLTSIVGSPHYVAPEITMAAGSRRGYDGAKADVWSAGIILYALLFGSLPFGKELAHCQNFERFHKWMLCDGESLTSIPWFFPGNISFAARSLLCSLLHPDANRRPTIEEALRHPWVQYGASADEKMDFSSFTSALKKLTMETTKEEDA